MTRWALRKSCLGMCVNISMKTDFYKTLKGMRTCGTEELVLWTTL